MSERDKQKAGGKAGGQSRAKAKPSAVRTSKGGAKKIRKGQRIVGVQLDLFNPAIGGVCVTGELF
jgi:hypothetical protein